MENQNNQNRKFTSTCYTIARVTGDAETRTGKNGKPYRIVPVELLGGRKSYAFCNAVPEIDSYAMVRVQPRETEFAYTLLSPDVDAIAFLNQSVAHWAYKMEIE